MNSCNTDTLFSDYYHLKSVRFELLYKSNRPLILMFDRRNKRKRASYAGKGVEEVVNSQIKPHHSILFCPRSLANLRVLVG